MTLEYTSQRLTLYVGYCLFITGIIGNGINIWVFSKYSYRRIPCTFYFLIGSICNILIIVINLSNRLLTVGYQIDLAGSSDVWCKTRQFLLVLTSPLAITCSCLAMIDQFFVTSRSQSLRNCSQIKWTYRILIIATIIWVCNGIPFLLYFKVSPVTNSCINTNPNFNIYLLIYLLGSLFLIPILIMILFGWLTYRNIHRTIALANQNVDRQLVKMTLFQVGLVIISFLPFGIYTLYTLATDQLVKKKNVVLIETFIWTIINLLAYLFHSVSVCVK